MSKSIESEQAASGSIVTIALRMSIVFIILCGIIYPLISTGIAQVIMPGKANGSLLTNSQGVMIGSELIGQKFTDPGHFQGRISSIEYNGAGSGSNNYAPSNPALLERTQASIEEWKTNNPSVPLDQVPLSLLTNSGSGLDPHITPESAQAQIPRISKAAGIPVAQLESLVAEHTEGRDLGVFGEKRVNVLLLNVAMEKLKTK
ncbi:Potassium-transporting ATPase C chain [compost metagenome]